jgi:hypothetical protein
VNVGLILDADALLSYAHGSDQIGDRIAKASDLGLSVLIPATSLAEAYRTVESANFRYLDIISALPNVAVTPLEADLCLFVGGWARKLGLELAHAAVEASSYPDALLATGRRELVTEHLPKEWPIIDVRPQ